MSQIGTAIRQLKRHPALSLIVILMLAVGIGATTAMFSLFHQVLVQPLPVPEPYRLVNIVRTDSGQGFSHPMFRDLEAKQDVLSGIAADWPFVANLAYSEDATSLPATYVSGGYFAVLGLNPSLGRLIGPQAYARKPRALRGSACVCREPLPLPARRASAPRNDGTG
jgi:hypothetical protein